MTTFLKPGGGLPIVVFGLSLAAYQSSVRVLNACNDGELPQCEKVAKSEQAKITNPEYLEKLKSEKEARDAENARKVQEESKRRAAEAEAKAAAERSKSFWNYFTSTDSASGKEYKVAQITSENTINLDFPYSGEQYATFTLRRHPRYGLDAFLSIRKGLILCNTYNNSYILLRADNGPVQRFGCNEPADNSSETVFVSGFGRVEQLIKRAKKLYVTITLYQAGDRTFEFKVQNYDASKL